jgi:hypothetical protein
VSFTGGISLLTGVSGGVGGVGIATAWGGGGPGLIEVFAGLQVCLKRHEPDHPKP